MVLVKDKKTDDISVMFLDGPAEYLNELMTKGPAKTAFGALESQQIALMGGATQQELDKTTPVSEKQLKRVFPYAVAMKMKDPLTRVDKTRIHDNIRRDGATKRALLFIAYFMIPEPPMLTLGLNKKYATKQREAEHMSEIQNNPDYLDILEELMNRDDEDDIDLFSREIELIFAAHGYGRAVQVKQYRTNGFPSRLIPLSSTRLGNVWVDRRNHTFLGVEYNDYPTDNRILLAQDIIHYEVDDFNVTPNSRYFGMSPSEATMSIGERNRAANEIAIPEIMKKMFAPLMLVKNKAKGVNKLGQIRDAWKSGKTVFYNSDIEIQVVAIPHDLEKLRDTVEEGAKQIFRDHTVPLGVAWQDDQNRATFEGSVLQWYESVLAFKRSQFSNVMWRQWYKPQLELIYSRRNEAQALVNGQVLQYLEYQATQTEPQILPFRISLEYKNVKTTGFLDTFAALAQWFDRKLISPDIARTEGGMGKYNDEMSEYELENTSNFTSLDNAMNVEQGVPNIMSLATQSTSNFSKGLPTASPTSPDRE